MSQNLKKDEESFARSALNIALGTGLNVLIGFFCVPIITRLVSTEDYGRLSIFNLYISIIVLVLCFGLDQVLVRYYYADKNITYRSWLAKICTSIPLAAAVLFLATGYAVIVCFDLQFEFKNCMVLFCCAVICHLLFRFSTLLLRMESKSFQYSICNVTNKCIYILFAFILITLSDSDDFLSLAIATTVGYTCASVIALFVNRKIWLERIPIVYRSPVRVSELFKYGLPFIIALGLTSIFEAIDKFSLNYFCDYSTVGIYTSAINVVNVFAIIQTSFNMVWAPVSVKHYEENPTNTEFYSKYNSTITVIMFAFGLTLILFKDVLVMLLGDSYKDAVMFIPFLVLHPIMYTVSETTMTGIVVKKKSACHLITSAVACMVNLCGNFVLIPLIGAVGAAISTGFSYVVFYMLRTIMGYHYFKVNFHQKKFAVLTVETIIFATLCTFSVNYWLIILCYGIAIISLLLLYRSTIKHLFLYTSSKIGKVMHRE